MIFFVINPDRNVSLSPFKCYAPQPFIQSRYIYQSGSTRRTDEICALFNLFLFTISFQMSLYSRSVVFHGDLTNEECLALTEYAD